MLAAIILFNQRVTHPGERLTDFSLPTIIKFEQGVNVFLCEDFLRKPSFHRTVGKPFVSRLMCIHCTGFPHGSTEWSRAIVINVAMCEQTHVLHAREHQQFTFY